MNGEPIVVEFSDGRTVDLMHVIATQRLTRRLLNRNPVTQEREKEYSSLEVIQNFGNGTFDPDVETHMLQIQTARGWDISVLDKDDIALFDGAWGAYTLWRRDRTVIK